MLLRPETADDADAIRTLTARAFAGAARADGTEPAIVDALRAAGALTLSLVAEDEGEILGHAAFSPVTVEGAPGRWFGLGPVSVAPARQRQGLGSALIRDGLSRLRLTGATGCVVLGDPAYYARFGFVSDPALRYGDIDPAYFQRLVFTGPAPKGQVAYHRAFEVA